MPADQSDPNAGAPTADSAEYQNYNDTLGHGTHVAGTIAALTNDALGVAGVAGNVSAGLPAAAAGAPELSQLQEGCQQGAWQKAAGS